MDNESKNDLTIIERIRVEGELKIRQQELEFEKTKWEKEIELREYEIKKDSRFRITPGLATIFVAVIGLIGAALGAFFQGYANL
jgi:hypothetical protein